MRIRLILAAALLASVAACVAHAPPPPAPPPGTRPAPPATCHDAVVAAMEDLAAHQFQMLQSRAEPAGELGIFSDGTTVRLEYLAYSEGIANYLTEHDWTLRTSCTADGGEVRFILERSIKVEHAPSAPGEQARREVGGARE